MSTGWFILWLVLTAGLFYRIGWVTGARAMRQIVKASGNLIVAARRSRRLP